MNTLPTFETELRVTCSARPSAISPGSDRYEPVPLGSHFWCCLVLFGAVWCSLVLKIIVEVAKAVFHNGTRGSSSFQFYKSRSSSSFHEIDLGNTPWQVDPGLRPMA